MRIVQNKLLIPLITEINEYRKQAVINHFIPLFPFNMHGSIDLDSGKGFLPIVREKTKPEISICKRPIIIKFIL